jgi:hypothetical protein
MSEMLERVARAILKEERNLDLELSNDLTKQSYYRLARAAIAAMHEPTLEMRHAGRRVKSSWLVEQEEVEIWQSMIDAALNDVP